VDLDVDVERGEEDVEAQDAVGVKMMKKSGTSSTRHKILLLIIYS
jgi:hypothetical protein